MKKYPLTHKFHKLARRRQAFSSDYPELRRDRLTIPIFVYSRFRFEEKIYETCRQFGKSQTGARTVASYYKMLSFDSDKPGGAYWGVYRANEEGQIHYGAQDTGRVQGVLFYLPVEAVLELDYAAFNKITFKREEVEIVRLDGEAKQQKAYWYTVKKYHRDQNPCEKVYKHNGTNSFIWNYQP